MSLGPSTAWVISRRIAIAGSNAAPTLADCSRAANSFLTLSRSASFIASMNWPWNSAAMRRILPMTWPTVRMTRGRSFGGMTARATMPKIRSLPTSKSNMERSGHTKT